MTILNLKQLFPFVIAFSAIIGAYTTTIEYRIKQDLPLVTSDCYCPFCGHPLSILHQIPILSWIFLRGKCHYCKHPIPLRYPLIEAGFIFYYCNSFLLFHSRPAVYLVLWFLFVTLFLLIRSDRHYKSLVKGLSIMYSYHLLFSFVLLLINESLKMS